MTDSDDPPPTTSDALTRRLGLSKWQRVSRIALWTLTGSIIVTLVLFLIFWWLVQPGGLLHDAAGRWIRNAGFDAGK